MTGLITATSYADQTSSCSQIADRKERLECFDREFPGEVSVPSDIVSTKAAPATAGPNAETPVEDARINQTSLQKPKRKMSLGGLLDWKRQPEVATEITAIRAGSKQRMVFRLANGQIWMQSTPRALPFKAGDKVTIKSGTVGGYIMRSASGTSSRVSLIEG
jgi:hypothetical protein